MPIIEKGDIFNTNEGGRVEVLTYTRAKDVLVRHLDKFGYEARVSSCNLRKGKVKNPYFASVYGVGFIGVGEYLTVCGGKPTPEYTRWRSMMNRSYCLKYHDRRPTYRGVSVTPEWHNFQTFAEWSSKQPNSRVKGYDLDKEMRVLGSKVYSPETCSYLPQEVNKILLDGGASRGSLPTGVIAYRDGWRAQVNVDGNGHMSSTFKTVGEALDWYKTRKEDNVRSVASKYKENIHPEVYMNLIKWEVLCQEY